MSAQTYEQFFAFSKTAQGAIGTASTDVIRIPTINDDLAEVDPIVEDDSDEFGKGHEFAEESFLTSWNVSKKVEVYNCAEMLGIAAAFGLGSGSTGTYTPIDPITNTNELELPWMTVYEGIRPGSAGEVLDRALIGCVVEGFTMTLGSGPGRANSKLSIDLVGTGKITQNSGVTFPAKTPVHLLPSASLSCIINGTNYVTTKNFVSLELSWKNNVRLDSGFFPGSDFQTAADATTGAIRGRMEFGKRELMCKFSARFVAGSTELTTLQAQTSGTAVLGLTGGSGFETTITINQTKFKTAKLGNADGIVTVEVELSCQIPTGGASDDLVTFAVANSLGTIGRS
jgi:hypothetical protein